MKSTVSVEEIEPIEKKIKDALSMAEFGSFDEAHHKMWVIDQIVHILCGNQVEYDAWVAKHNDGEDGKDTYEWDIGIAP